MEYRLKAVLGEGGFGLTYLANDTHLDKQVAIKEFLPTGMSVRGPDGAVAPTSAAHVNDFQWGLDRFAKEARTLAKFAHPNIVRVNRFFSANGTGYMVMDFEDGDSLKSWVRQNPDASEAELGALFAPLMDGLEKVHAAGFLHRDIKPDNIVVRHSGGPVLIDFGSARQSAGDGPQAMTTIVTPGYAPFEQYTQTTKQGPWTDVYALAGALFFVVARQSPPDAMTRMKDDKVAQLLTQARQRYSKAFIDAIVWGLAVDDAKRARSVSELRDALFGKAPTTEVKAAPRMGDTTTRTRPVEAVTTRAKPVDEEVTLRVNPAVTSLAAGGPTVQANTVAARTAALASVAMPQQAEEKRTSVLPRLLGYGFTVVILLLSGLLLMGGGTKPPVVAKPAPPPVPVVAAPIQPAEAAASVSDTPAPAPATANPPPVADVTQGMSREQFIQTYPHLASRFEVIDSNRDGRISVSELVDGMQQFGVK